MCEDAEDVCGFNLNTEEGYDGFMSWLDSIPDCEVCVDLGHTCQMCEEEAKQLYNKKKREYYRDNPPRESGKDPFGRKVVVGNTVAFRPPKHKQQLIYGIVIKITPKLFTVNYDPVFNEGDLRTTSRRKAGEYHTASIPEVVLK